MAEKTKFLGELVGVLALFAIVVIAGSFFVAGRLLRWRDRG